MIERQKIPPRRKNPFESPKGEKPFLQHKEVGRVPRRGEVFAQVRVSPKSSRELDFVIDAIRGTVERPLFREKPGVFGEIEKISTAKTEGLSRSERREFHKAEGVEKEKARIHKVSEAVGNIHAYLYRNRTVLQDPKMRIRLETKLQELINVLNPNSRKKTKVKAIARLTKAIELTRKGNVMMVISALGGIHGDMGIRKSAHNIQEPRARRTAEAHRRDIREIMVDMRSWLKETKEVMRPLSGKSARVQDLDSAAVFCERQVHWMSKRQGEGLPPEFIEMRISFEEAAKALRARNIVLAGRWMARTRANQISFYGRHFLLPAAILRTVIEWPPGPKKSTVLVRQAHLAGENIVFWSKERNLAWVSPWLRVLTQIAERTPAESQNVPVLRKARNLVEQGKYAEAKEKLLSIPANVAPKQ